jgi:probable rRNA maturation factor
MYGANFVIEIMDRQTFLSIDQTHIRSVIQQILIEENVESAEISVAFVDDARIHELNRDYLGHDYPTDVISFCLDHSDRANVPGGTARVQDSGLLEAELVVSAQTAVREAPLHGWSAADELTLYVVHGTLHLCGYDDLTDEARPIMRERERHFLSQWHLIPSGLEV